MDQQKSRISASRASRPLAIAIVLAAVLVHATTRVMTAPAGLVAAYGFNEGSGTSVTDASGAGNAGSISGATRTASGRFGGALSFDGVDDIVTAADRASLDLTTGMTLEAWVFPKTTAGWKTIVMKERSTTSLSYSLQLRDLALPHSEVHTGSMRRADGPSALPMNQWTHVASTYDGATLRVYVNGVQVKSVAATGGITTSTSALRIGGNAIWGEYFNGLIDEVRVYNRALTATEIATDRDTPVEGGGPPPDATAPTVSVTSPASGATVSGSVTIAASAADNVGVSSVTFKVDGASVGTDSSSPYSAVWNASGAAPGAHAITAEAVDAAGNVGTSAAVSVTVPAPPANQPPAVSLTAPADGATFTAPATVTVSASASDADGSVTSVDFYAGATLLGSDTSSPYSLSWSSVSAGTYSLTAIARDNVGAATTSAARSITVNSSAPPASGLVAAYAFSEASGTAVTDRSSAGNSGTLSGAARTASGRFGAGLSFDGVDDLVTVPDSASLDLTAGMTIEAWVYPRTTAGWRTIAMKERPSSPSYSLSARDGGQPHTELRTSANRRLDGPSPLPLNQWTHLASTYDGTTFRLYVNGTQAASMASTGAIAVSGNPLRIGGDTIWSEYFDGVIDEVRVYSRALSAGEIATDRDTPVDGGAPPPPPPPPPPDGTAPAVSITSPASGVTVSGTVAVAANASDNVGVTLVTFKVNGASIGTDSSSPYSASWNTVGSAAGSYTITAEARDAAGNTATSATVSVTIAPPPSDGTAPTVSVTSPANGATVSGTVAIAANASDNVGVTLVTFKVNGASIGTDSSSPYGASWNTAGLAAGSYTLTAEARDAAGNTGTSAPITVTIQAPSPVPTTVRFYPSPDHGSMVDFYRLEVYTAGANPGSSNAVQTQNLGKPPVVSGECTADIAATIQSLPGGSYVAVVSAVGGGGSSQSIASLPFTR